jgi:hypothetical protein
MQRSNLFVSCLAGLLVASSIVSSRAFAQASPIGKGSWIISGTAGVNSQHFDGSDQTSTTVFVAPNALYFVAPGLAIGGQVSLGYGTNPSNTTTSFGIGPSIRYFFADQHAKTLPFASATVSPQWTSADPKGATLASSSTHGLGIEGTAGMTFLLVPHVGVTGEAYYDHSSMSGDVGSLHVTQSGYSIGVRFGVTAFVF